MTNSKYGNKALNVMLPAQLHAALKRISANSGCSIKHIISEYIRWLAKQDTRNPKFINAQTKKTDFTIDTTESDELH